MPDKNVPWLLLERYFAGMCTPEEEAALDSWLGGDPRRRLLVERLRNVFSDTPPTPNQSDIERAWTNLATKMNPDRSRTFTIAALLTSGVLALLGLAWFVVRHAAH